MEGSFGWGWVVDLKFVFHSLKPINTDLKYFLLKVEISNPGVLKESIADTLTCRYKLEYCIDMNCGYNDAVFHVSCKYKFRLI